MTETRARETSSAFLKRREEGVLEIRLKDGAFVDIVEGRALIRAVREISEGEILPCIAILGNMAGVSREARHYFSSLQEVRAIAMVVNSPIARAVGNFFLGLNRLVIPVRLVQTEAQGVEWALARSDE